MSYKTWAVRANGIMLIYLSESPVAIFRASFWSCCHCCPGSCSQSMIVWRRHTTTRGCRRCPHPHRCCRSRPRVHGTQNWSRRPNYCGSTRDVWKQECKSWRITTNSWNHSSNALDSYLSRWVVHILKNLLMLMLTGSKYQHFGTVGKEIKINQLCQPPVLHLNLDWV